MADRIDILKGVLLIQEGKRQKLFNRVGEGRYMYEGYDFMGEVWNRNWDRVHADIERLEREIQEEEDAIDPFYGTDDEFEQFCANGEEFYDEHVFDKHQGDDYEQCDIEQFGTYDDKASTDDILTGVQYDIDGKME